MDWLVFAGVLLAACALLAAAVLLAACVPWVLAATTRWREFRAARERRRREPIDAWTIELDGEPIGELLGCISDMFWRMFLVLGDDPRLFDDALWRAERFRFRHAISGRAPAYAWIGRGYTALPTREAPYVWMRGLY